MALRGLLPVIPTPLVDDEFDEPSFRRLLDHILPHLDGYTLLGSTGEAPSMTTEERMSIAELALAQTPPDKTVVVGVSSTSVRDSIALARHAEGHGARGVLCSAPYYFANSASGVLGYLTLLDAVLETELVLYDNPVSTRTVLAAADVVEWSRRLDHMQTVKLTDHDLAKIGTWHEAGLTVLAGDDPIMARFLAAGVDGAMMIGPAIFPASFRRAWDLAQLGDGAGAFEVLATDVLPFVHAFGIGDEIATSKSILADLGIFTSREVRLPLESASHERRAIPANGLQQLSGLGQLAVAGAGSLDRER